jgi:hypothetical protein
LRKFIAAFAFQVLWASVLSISAASEEKGGTKPIHTLQAIQASGRITLDGVLNEETWAIAVPESDFSQRDPDEGKAPAERKELRVAFDRSAICFGVRLFDLTLTRIYMDAGRRQTAPKGQRNRAQGWRQKGPPTLGTGSIPRSTLKGLRAYSTLSG